MATLGKALTAPESGWQRINDDNENITYNGAWYSNSSSSYYGGTLKTSLVNTSSACFNFTGTKIRILGTAVNHTRYSGQVVISIDGTEYSYTHQYSATAFQALLFDKTDLSDTQHYVKIYSVPNIQWNIDAIDIDSNGTIAPYNSEIEAPTNLVAALENSQVTLSWSAVTGAASYNVKRATTSGGEYTTIATGVADTSYVDTAIENGVTYYYVVSAVTSDGESSNSNEASVSTPMNLIAIAGDAQVTLTWATITGAISYNIKRATTSGGEYATIASGVTDASYIDTNVENGITYYYVVSVVTENGEGTSSNEASATPVEEGRVLLVIEMVNGLKKEYKVTVTEVEAFLTWYKNRADDTGDPYYIFDSNFNLGPFTSRKDYLAFDKIQNFEVMAYTE
ncbi:fibronectin type III domain-containing protein [Sporomusa aerivorans]|uniref:fibronectin type III domain-containing protein n=1 Tax=Sporomusa aerivorans TaxID=204936 RepID=UPI00352B182A